MTRLFTMNFKAGNLYIWNESKFNHKNGPRIILKVDKKCLTIYFLKRNTQNIISLNIFEDLVKSKQITVFNIDDLEQNIQKFFKR